MKFAVITILAIAAWVLVFALLFLLIAVLGAVPGWFCDPHAALPWLRCPAAP